MKIAAFMIKNWKLECTPLELEKDISYSQATGKGEAV